MKIVLFTLVIKSILLLSVNSQEDDCVIEIENGKIRGKPVITTNNITIYAFLEIPYAAPPIGNLRFKEAQYPKNWTGILNTTKITKICWESKLPKLIFKPQENEDCLYLNVYIPELPRNGEKRYPVVMYIYGGVFRFGSTLDYNPQLFVEAGVIFITIQFRSGPFGFLTTEDGIIPANLGLRDQNFALKWIQRNIQYFGGDPEKVTLMGHSSGGVCVSHHIFSKKSAGLFRSAIVQSAAGIGHMSIIKNARAVAYAVGKTVSRDFTENNSTTDLHKLLLNVSARTLVDVPFQLPDISNSSITNITILSYGPVLENPDSENTFLDNYPHDDMVTGNFNRIPLLTGIAAEEILGIYKYKKLIKYAKYFDENPKSLISNYVNVKKNKRNILGEVTKNLYTNLTFQEDPKALIRIFSDLMYCFSTIRQAELHSKFSDVYFYQFSFRGELNTMTMEKRNDIEGLGRAGHGDEVSYLLYLHELPELKLKPASYGTETVLTQKRLIKIWTNFIKYANPTPELDPILQSIMWPKFSENSLEFLDIDNVLTIKKDPRNYTKWLPVFEKYYDHPIDVI